MILTRLIPGLVCAAFLAACGTTDPAAGKKLAQVPMADSMAAAEAAIKAGQSEKAIAMLKDAARAHPADKTPWVRMAQVRFDGDDYGQAIVHAQEAIQRDGDDTLAHSIAAVSGLRVASKALADLTRKNNLSGTIRSEAQDLAKLLRASLGEETLVPGRNTRAAAAPPKKPASAPAASAGARKQGASDDPFGSLQ
jgi:predicted Zn-dependent protease